ncbi:MAG TPA: gliding motility-associated C-terminal domain-containing protein [Bacteroidales bacterium]|nr:gliding motility-associated C-terminal domain-containing protein [Bacteroidales bacterium]HSA42941.1 gliding motility-associated C-terminal domain-containing protein [Bacteroidales bacterium]
MKRIFASILFFLTISSQLSASHYMGGEIYWECMPNGQYRFHMRVYQECAGILYSTVTETLNTTVPGLPSITMYFIDSIDISPTCFPGLPPLFQHINCETTSISNTGGVREWIYQSNPVSLPAGPPPPTGWVFSFTGCCRNPCTNITGTTNMNWYLRAIMYPYENTPVNTCWDNSPRFVERPSTVICTGYPFSYNPNAYDPELDSLSYEWDQPWTGNNQPIPAASYVGGYTWNSPLPGPTQNPNNIPASVNQYTGEISFTSYTQGAFVTVNKVSAYRCGIKIAEIFREMQVVLLPCPGNDPPTVIIQYPNGDTLNNYVDTVFAGALVKYSMWAYDGQMLNDTFTPQNIKVTGNGIQLGLNGISTTTGCLNPPCAMLFWGDTINPLPLPAMGVWALNTQFRWQTECTHLATELACGGVTNQYNFVIRTADDYCPAPAIRWTTITIIVRNAIMLPPSPRCISVQPNGHVKLEWVLPDTSEIPNTWNAYLIFRSKSPTGPFTLIDSLKTINQYTFYSTSWTDLTAYGNDTMYYYYMQTRSGCYGNYYSGNSDTLNTIRLNVENVGNGIANTQWNGISDPLPPTSTGWYNVYRLTGNNWVTLNSTQGFSSNDAVTGCGYIKFRVGLADSSGCESLSNIDSALFQAATPPDARCVAVQPNGSVTISFVPPPDTNSFYFSGYLIYAASNPLGPYNLVDSVKSMNQFSKNVTAINANGASQYLYIINRIDCDGFFFSDASDTLRTMYLSLSSIDQEHANLFWNEIHTPALPTTSGLYDIYRSYPVGSWNPLTQTALLTAIDSLTICGDTIPYRVEVGDQSGCVSVSNINGVKYWDDDPPAIPVIDTVSIDSLTGYTHISWFYNDAETQGFIIFYDNNGSWMLLDTVFGNNSNSYIDRSSPGNACDAPKTYVILAFDSCWNPSGMSLNMPHNTLHLEISAIDPCADKITMHWNPYINMHDFLGGYRIYATENGGPPFLLGTNLPAGPGLPAATSFVHENFTKDSYYCYYVQAFNQDGTKTSSSCYDCILATKPKQPQFLVFRNVSVETTNKVKVKLFVDTSAYVTEYRILRATEKAGPYELITTIPGFPEPYIEYLDETALPVDQAYYYFASVIDSCGVEVMHSDTVRSIHLMAVAMEDFTNYLSWNDFEGWSWTYVRGYNLFRGIDGLVDPIPLATVPYGTNTFVDEVSPYFETQGKFRYYVEAIPAPSIFPFVDTSYSNRASDIQDSKIYIPNAFSPKGYNPIFKPISIYADKSHYIFMIYNRWGELLFETNNPNEGWDGTYEDKYVPVGVYMYYVKFHTSRGETFEKRGTVTVVK